MPSPEAPLKGRCLCGAVRFAVTAPFQTAGYCHCERCQRRSGTTSTLNARVAAKGFEILEGAEMIRTWRPPDGQPKSFCANCGGHLFSGDPEGDGMVGVRLGAIDGDPGIRPSWRQWVSSAPTWEAIPDDGLERFSEGRGSGHRADR
jgi:hypothetical protein